MRCRLPRSAPCRITVVTGDNRFTARRTGLRGSSGRTSSESGLARPARDHGHPDGVESDLASAVVRWTGLLAGLRPTSRSDRSAMSSGMVADDAASQVWNCDQAWWPAYMLGHSSFCDGWIGQTFDPRSPARPTSPSTAGAWTRIDGFALLAVDARSGTLIGPRFRSSRAACGVAGSSRGCCSSRRRARSQFISVASGGAEDAPIRLPIDLSWQRLTRPAMVE